MNRLFLAAVLVLAGCVSRIETAPETPPMQAGHDAAVALVVGYADEALGYAAGQIEAGETDLDELGKRMAKRGAMSREAAEELLYRVLDRELPSDGVLNKSHAESFRQAQKGMRKAVGK